jgi:hypothetical protein
MTTYRLQLLCLLGGLVLFNLSSNDALGAGAVTPFTTLEAEAGSLSGGATVSLFTPGSAVPTKPTLQLEASGLSYVLLTNVGNSVSWTNPVPGANAMVIRSCLPDTTNGGGITATLDLYVDGTFRQAITLSSRQSWNYRNSTTTPDDPNGGGSPWHFYNEDRTFIGGAAIAAGSVLKLQKDPTNTSPYYIIDCIDLENVPPPGTQPANSLSVVSYGADPTFTTDSTVAIQNCITTAQAQNKTVWIPQGKFMVNSLASGGLSLGRATVQGAGMWYSTIYRNIPLPPPTTPWRSNISLNTNAVLQDVSIDSDSLYRSIGGISGDDYGVTSAGSNWLIMRVWVQHCDANWLSGSYGMIRDCRVADSWADGINLNNGNTPNSSKLGISLTASNNFVRGSGDDGFATYSDAGASGSNPQMQNTRIVNNTSMATYWANGLRIAGGTNVVVQGNLVDSVSANNGMEVSIFGNTGNSLDLALISGNTILRGGGWNGTDRHGMHVGSPGSASIFSNAYTHVIITNNFIRHSLRAGLAIGPVHDTVTVLNNVIDHPSWQGIWIEPGVTGTGVFDSNLVTNMNAGQSSFRNDSPATFLTTLTNNSWQTLSQGKPATASSFQAGNGITNGNDGNVATRWTAASSSMPQWWQVDLGASRNITSVAVDWYSSSTRGYGYQIAVSSDNTDFTTVVDKSTNTLVGNTTDNFSALARYVKITVASCTATGGFASFYECNVYGSFAPAVALSPTNLTAVLAGNILTLSWPADHLGWRLQAQTNALLSGLTTNWVVLPGTDLVISTNLTINPANGAVRYRMVYP